MEMSPLELYFVVCSLLSNKMKPYKSILRFFRVTAPPADRALSLFHNSIIPSHRPHHPTISTFSLKHSTATPFELNRFAFLQWRETTRDNSLFSSSLTTNLSENNKDKQERLGTENPDDYIEGVEGGEAAKAPFTETVGDDPGQSYDTICGGAEDESSNLILL